MLCIVWVPAIFGGPRGSHHLDLTVEFHLYLNMVVEEKQQHGYVTASECPCTPGNLLENWQRF